MVNILIHAATGVLLFLFFKITLSLDLRQQRNDHAHLLAFSAALLWTVHPLHVQSVTYIIQRMNSLAAMFYILAMLLYIRGRIAPVLKKKVFYFFGCLLSGLLALGSKEIAATLPFFILLYEWFFLQGMSRAWVKKRLLPMAAVGVLLVIIGVFYLGTDPLTLIKSSYRIRDFTLIERVLTEFRVVVFYISQVFLPHPSRLNLEHHFSVSTSMFDPFTTILSLLLLLSLFTAGIMLARKQRILSFAIFWFLGNLLIESSVIGLEIIFEHRTYLPSMFIILAVAVLADRLLQEARLKKAVLVLVVIMFSIWTFQRNMVWQDELTLAKDSALKSPDKPRAQMNLGRAFEAVGDYENSVRHYEKAISLNPSIGAAMLHYNLGNVLAAQNKLDEAVAHYWKAVSLEPGKPAITINLAVTLSKQKRYAEAENILKDLLQRHPQVAGEIHNNLGIIMSEQGRLASAEFHFAESVRLGFPLAALNLEEIKKERAKRARENYMFLRTPGSQKRTPGR